MPNPLFDDAKKPPGASSLFPVPASQPQPPASPQWEVLDAPPPLSQIAPLARALPPIPAGVDDSWVSGLGEKQTSHIAAISKSLLDRTKGTELESFGLKIGELISTAKGLNIGELKNKGFLGKIKSLFASAKERFLAQYNTATKQIDRFIIELQASASQQQKRIEDLERLFEANMQEHQNLTSSIAEGSAMVAQLQTQLAQVDPSGLDAMGSQRFYDQRALVERLDKRVDDLKRVCLLAEQTAPQIRLMQENARLLVNKFNDIKNLTIPAWQKQFALQVILLEQEKGAKLAEAIDDATNAALRRSADLLRQNTSAINKAAQRSVIDLETLEHINKQTIGALEDTRKILDEGRQQRLATDGRLEQMRAELLAGLNAG